MVEEAKSEVVNLGKDMSPEDMEKLSGAIDDVKAQAEARKAQEEDNQADTSPDPDPGSEGEKEPEACTKCGFKEGDEDPPEEDMQEYMRAVLGGRRFTKTYELMRGQITLQFSTIDTAASERVNNVVGRLGVLEDPVAFRAYATKMNLVYMLLEYKIGSDTKKFDTAMASTPDEITAEFKERYSSLDESVVQMFSRTLGDFIHLKSALINACFDESFYKGAGQF